MQVEQELRTLLLAGLDGDAVAYRCFLDQLAQRLRAFLRRRLTDMHDHIEDIVQETLLAVHNGRHSYRKEDPLTSWVHAIAKYKLMDFLRVCARRDALNDSLDDYIDVFATTEEEVISARRDVDALLDQLPDRQRLPIQLVKLQGWSVAEAAQATGLSESAVKIGVHRGMKALALRIRTAIQIRD
jgi:RNA polymerase sigma-70 factor (ECF subfamily)